MHIYTNWSRCKCETDDKKNMGGVNGKDIFMKETEKYKSNGDFPILVAVHEYERIKSHNDSVTDPTEKYCGDDASLFDRLETIYKLAVEESNLPLAECMCPAVIMTKYGALTAEEKETFTSSLVQAIVLQDALHHHKLKNNEDYAQSFGGTEADSKNEKDAAEMLRGSLQAAEETDSILRPPNVTHGFEHAELRKSGKWSKYMGGSGCYMYIHNLTKDIVSIRPEEYNEVDDTAKILDTIPAQEVDPANGIKRVHLRDLPDEVDRIVKELKRTPLIIDCSPEQAVRSFYEYKAILEVSYDIIFPNMNTFNNLNM